VHQKIYLSPDFTPNALKELIELYKLNNMSIESVLFEGTIALHVVSKERREDLLDILLENFDNNSLVHDEINSLPLHSFASSRVPLTQDKINKLYQADFSKN